MDFQTQIDVGEYMRYAEAGILRGIFGEQRFFIVPGKFIQTGQQSFFGSLANEDLENFQCEQG